MRRDRAAAALGGLLLAVTACASPSLDDAAAQDAVEGLPGVDIAGATCSTPVEGPRCTLDVQVTSSITVDEVVAVVDAARPVLVDDVVAIRFLDGSHELSLGRGALDDAATGAGRLGAMRALDAVRSGEVVLRGGGDRAIRVSVVRADDAAEVAARLRTDEVADVTVEAPGMRLMAAAGVPEAEARFALRVADRFDVASTWVDTGKVVVYCRDEQQQRDVEEAVDDLEGRDDVDVVDVFVDPP